MASQVGDILRLKFTDIPLDGAKISFFYDEVILGVTQSIEVIETFNEVDQGTFSIQIQDTIAGNAQAFAEAFTTDYYNVTDASTASNIGPDLITNGDFGTSTGWNITGSWSIDIGSASIFGASGPSGSLTQLGLGLEAGSLYRVEWDFLSPLLVIGNDDSLKISLGSSGSGVGIQNFYGGNFRNIGLNYFELEAGSDNDDFSFVVNNTGVPNRFEGRVDNLSVKKIQNFNIEYVNESNEVSIQTLNGLDIYNATEESLISVTGSSTPTITDTDVYSLSFVQFSSTTLSIGEKGIFVRSPEFTFSPTFGEQQRNRMTFTFSSNPSAAESITFRAIRNNVIVRTMVKTFHATSNTSTLIPVGQDLQETILNIRNNLQEFDDLFYFEYIIDTIDDKLYLDVFDQTPAPNWQITANTSTISGVTASGTFSETSTSFNVFVYEGSFSATSSEATTPIFSKSKQKILENQTRTFIDFTPLVRSKLEFDINTYQLNNPQVRKLSSGTGRWVRVETSNQIFGFDRTISKANNNYYITDGYITPNQTQRMPNILTTGNKKFYNSLSMAKLYFKTRGLKQIKLQKIPFNLGDPTIILSNNVFDTFSNSDEYLNSLRLIRNQSDTGDFQRYTWTYGTTTTTTSTHIIEVKWTEECKYDPIDIYFINKFGVVETINFNKLHTVTLNSKSDDFSRSIVDVEGRFDRKRHTKKEFNATGRQKWVLNTDFIPESMNFQFEELFLSESVWVTALTRNTFLQEPSPVKFRIINPVIITDSSILFKQHLNDKLIQYTITVELSNERVNNIR